MSPDDGDLIRPETDTEVAEKLGVSQQLVTKVCNRTNGSIITHDRGSVSTGESGTARRRPSGCFKFIPVFDGSQK